MLRLHCTIVGGALIASWLPPSYGVGTSAVDDQGADEEAVFNQKCSACHSVAPPYGEKFGPDLHGPDFEARWSGKPLRGLYAVIANTMPLNEPATLTEAEILAVVRYVLRKNGHESVKADNIDDIEAGVVP